MEVPPASWSASERVGSFAAMLIGAGKRPEGALGARLAALEGHIAHATHVGPLVRVGSDGIVTFNSAAAWRYLVLLYSTGFRFKFDTGKVNRDDIRVSAPVDMSAERPTAPAQPQRRPRRHTSPAPAGGA